MKEISVIRFNQDIPWWRDRKIFVQVLSFSPNTIKQIISSDGTRVIWYFDTHQYTLRPPGDMSYSLRCKRFAGEFGKKELFLQIKEFYPEDFQFFLWHPEVEFGIWNE